MNELMERAAVTIDSREIAEMMEMPHYKLLRKLEGDTDRKGFIEILTAAQMGVSDFFLESSYKDASGKENKCYLFTRQGCDFIANKFTGEKGIIFTAKYVKRFAEMEQEVKQPKQTVTPQGKELLALAVIEANKMIEEKDEKIKELEPKAYYTDNVLRNDSLIYITQIAKDYGFSGKQMNQFLCGIGVQYKVGKQWVLYAKYQGKGYTQSATVPRSNGTGYEMITMWTERGRKFLYDLLAEYYIYPLGQKEGTF